MEDIAAGLSQLSEDVSIDDEEPEETYEGKSFIQVKQLSGFIENSFLTAEFFIEDSYVSVKPHSL